MVKLRNKLVRPQPALLLSNIVALVAPVHKSGPASDPKNPGGGGLPYETDGDACRLA